MLSGKNNILRVSLAENAIPGRGYGRTLELLVLLAAHPDGLTVGEIAVRLATPKSTLRLMIQHFRMLGFVSLDQRQRVRMGPRLVQLAFVILDGFAVRPIAKPHLSVLARTIGENIYLAVLSGLDIINVDKFEGANLVRLNIDLGAPRPLHATAAGKAYLAFAAPDLLERYVSTRGLAAHTSRTITSIKRLEADLATIRAIGFAVSDEEVFEGICSFAVPVMEQGEIVAAISVSALRPRALQQKDTLIPAMRAARQAIERELASVAQRPVERKLQ